MGWSWLLVPVVVVCWWNSSVLVDGGPNNMTPGCNMAYLGYKTDTCLLSLEFVGSLPSWLLKQDIASEILNVDYSLLQTFAKEQVCVCRTLTAAPECPDNLRRAIKRVRDACPFTVRNITFTV